MGLVRHLFVLSGANLRKKQNAMASLVKFCNFAVANQKLGDYDSISAKSHGNADSTIFGSVAGYEP